MRLLGATRSDIEDNLFKATAFVTGSIVGVGLIFWLSISLVSVGSKIILVGAVVGVIGSLFAKIIPSMMRYDQIWCPSCATVYQVSNRAAKFSCEECGGKIFGQNFWRSNKVKAGRATQTKKCTQPQVASSVADIRTLKCKES